MSKIKQYPNPLRLLGAGHAEAIVRMMELVTGPGGSGQAAAINGYRVAGKTGTSRRTNPQGGYYTDQHRAIFVGLAPASDPRFVVAILVEDPPPIVCRPSISTRIPPSDERGTALI